MTDCSQSLELGWWFSTNSPMMGVFLSHHRLWDFIRRFHIFPSSKGWGGWYLWVVRLLSYISTTSPDCIRFYQDVFFDESSSPALKKVGKKSQPQKKTTRNLPTLPPRGRKRLRVTSAVKSWMRKWLTCSLGNGNKNGGEKWGAIWESKSPLSCEQKNALWRWYGRRCNIVWHMNVVYSFQYCWGWFFDIPSLFVFWHTKLICIECIYISML